MLQLHFKEVRRALLEADVNFNTAKAFTNSIKEKAIGANVLNSVFLQVN
jgi:signal recognition particle subunit SRP54